MIGYAAAILFVVLLTAGIFCFAYAVKRSSAQFVVLLELLFGVILILPILLFSDELNFPEIFTLPNKSNWLWLALAGITGFAGGNYFSLINLKYAGEKINALLSPAITALAVTLSWFVFKDALTMLQWTGIAIALTAVTIFLFSIKSSNDSNPNLKGAWSGVVTVVLISASIIFSIKGASDNISIFHAMWLRLLFALAVAVIAMLFKPSDVKAHQSTKFYLLIIAGVFIQTIAAGYLWFYASFNIGVPAFQTIIATLPLWVYAADVYLLRKTKPSILFLITSVIALGGIVMVMW